MNSSGASPTPSSVSGSGRLPNNPNSLPSPAPEQDWLGPSIQMLDSPTRTTARKLDYPPEEDSLFRDSSDSFSPGAPDFANWNSNNTQPQAPVFHSIFTGYAPSGHATPAGSLYNTTTTTTTTTSTSAIPVYTTTTTTATTTTSSTGTALAQIGNSTPVASGPTQDLPLRAHAEEKNLAGMITTGVTYSHEQVSVRVSSSLGEHGLEHHVLDSWGSGVIGGSAEVETAALPRMFMEVEYPSTETLLDEIWRRDPAVVTEVES